MNCVTKMLIVIIISLNSDKIEERAVRLYMESLR